MRRAVIILPNEELLPDTPVFIRDVLDNELHLSKVKNFFLNVRLTDKMSGIRENDIYGFEHYIKLVSLGQVLICVGEDNIIFLPEVVTPKQREWLLNNAHFLKKITALLQVDHLENEIFKEDMYTNGGNIQDDMWAIIMGQNLIDKEGRQR